MYRRMKKRGKQEKSEKRRSILIKRTNTTNTLGILILDGDYEVLLNGLTEDLVVLCQNEMNRIFGENIKVVDVIPGSIAIVFEGVLEAVSQKLISFEDEKYLLPLKMSINDYSLNFVTGLIDVNAKKNLLCKPNMFKDSLKDRSY